MRFRTFICIVLVIVVLAFAAVAAFAVLSSSPSDFPIGATVNIPRNATISEIATSLKERSFIRSEDAFKVAALMLGGSNGLLSGDYLFDRPTNVWKLVERITKGDQGIARVKVTFPEGITVKEMGNIVASQVSGFDAAGFVARASTSEGYLFPDTYYFFSNAKPLDVVRVIAAEFDQKYATLLSDPAIVAGTMYGKTKREIVTMASILEDEVKSAQDRSIVSGILWKRLAKGMPLQVDAPFGYILGKSTEDLTLDDLKTNSPYNTYLNKGLPPTPINNPGLEALRATMMPTSTPYWFYLSDKKGAIHYAKTYAEHLANKENYLNGK
ncbi:MAG: aminodeoxychorismate lyase, protein [Candidatus Taylorbacteria bacterium]|nr:aminodeoxychorismate lyase, protein [Candidatus Taylorbacteria bacterium]